MIARAVYFAAALFCLSPWAPAWAALGLGIAIALTLGNPFLERTRKGTSTLLQLSVIGLGAGMNLEVVGRVGLEGLGYTAAGIAFAFALGAALGRVLKVQPDTSVLISSGTAICGGSAIAAVGSAIQAGPADMSVSLATVFFLNSVALLLFPWLGHWFGLDQRQFGLWSALAIHDTSSVVGASLQYGSEALEIATTVKLARALWIVPVAAAIGYARNRKGSRRAGKTKKPWFILGFVLAAALVTWVPALKVPGQWVADGAKRSLVLTLFLIGSGLTRATLRAVGARPFLQGGVLWVVVGSSTLAAILGGWIR